MFRNPRENRNVPLDSRVANSVGRAPSPPPAGSAVQHTIVRTDIPALPITRMATKTKSPATRVPAAAKAAQRKAAPAAPKTPGKPNTLITSFFKKSDGVDGGLFWGTNGSANLTDDVEDVEHDEAWQRTSFEDSDRYQENGLPVKRRKTSASPTRDSAGPEPVQAARECTPPPDPKGASAEASIVEDIKNAVKAVSRATRGPFLEDSDSEDGGEEKGVVQNVPQVEDVKQLITPDSNPSKPASPEASRSPTDGKKVDTAQVKPSLTRQGTSCSVLLQDFDDFNGLPDEGDDDEDGEEFNYRQLAIEQRKLELSDGPVEGEMDDLDAEAVDCLIKEEEADDEFTTRRMSMDDQGDPEDATCPICTASLAGVSSTVAAIHVNNCLDGNPTPLPIKREDPLPMTIKREDSSSSVKVLSHKARKFLPKPGQQNPFTLAPPPTTKGGSAFSRLMSNHAEDLAWKTAAESEQASRGKPAFTRTCPFYKIMPGFSICVDAFRYGAVEGCKAYFLSHFHSDHYIGLTAKWCHGPIYCSKVTANLVKQQLGVDSRYVVALPWEEWQEIPGTNGVKVNMISANHCPGSSLYLFEKVIGQGQNPKVQRVLHCGDFRACKAHVKHPLLKPEVLDAVSGKTREQKIDVCYLDTTYLNPKYAFPSQADVIQACSDMCVSLSKEFKVEDDQYEQMKRERAGSGMVQFLADGTTKVKQEEQEPTDDRPAGQARGRLLVVVGTYSIGKERICLGIARALGSKIYAPPNKQRIVRALEDPELNALMTNDPREAQVHMTPLFEIRAETLDDYLKDFRDTFTRAVGFRPSGWNYRPPNSRFIESPSVSTVLYGSNWKSTYSMKDLMPQRGSTRRAACYGVPYSEHSSFRELTMFCCALKIDKVIPTVNVGSARSRERMRAWVDRWAVERKKVGLFNADDFGGIDTYADP